MQAVAHNRICCRASALAKDLTRFGEADDVVNGEKIILVGELSDQVEFFMNPCSDSCWYAVWPTSFGTGGDFLSQVAVGCVV